MITRSTKGAPDSLLRTLAEFRFELRRFLHFSECAALEAGLQPQQHQLLLQVAGAPESNGRDDCVCGRAAWIEAQQRG